MELKSDQPESERRKWKVVRLDTFKAISGTIEHADELTGIVKMKQEDGTSKEYDLGARGIKITRK